MKENNPDINETIEAVSAEPSLRVAIGLVCVDNFREAQSALDAEKKPMFSALIDRTLASFCQNADGILRKYEKDRYMLIISEKALSKEIEGKFPLLNKVKEINIGNTVSATLSVGVGCCYDSLAQGMESAKTALDLAIARGGDQAIIKDGQEYRFFGGKSGTTEKDGGIRARINQTALTRLIIESANVFVMGHTRSDLDSLGAAIGIYIIARHFGKKCGIVIEEVNSSIRKLYEKILEQPEYRGLFINNAKALKTFGKNSMLVIVDTHRPSICECPELLGVSHKTIVIDHHRRSPEFIQDCVMAYHEPYASSASELVTEMLACFDGGLSIKPLEADALLAGITMDTKNFSIKTGPRTFEAAGFLRRNRADTIRVRKLLQNDMESFKARNEVVRAAQIFRGNIAISVCPHNVENAVVVAAMAADELLNIVGIQVSFVLTITDLYIMISARSLGDINVQRIMEKLGGGGHQTVAGAQLPLESDMDLETAIQMIKDATTEYLDEEVQ